MKNPFISNTRKTHDQFLMTPELAAFLLAHFNKKNVRPLDWNEAIKRIARGIKRGEWNPNSGQRLIFERITGMVLDGQTRLAGIVEAGVPVLVDILWGVETSVHTGFGGRTRSKGASIAQVLGMDCTAAIAFSKMAGASGVWLSFLNQWKDMRFTREEIMQHVIKNQAALKLMLEKRIFKETRRAGVAAALAFYYSQNQNKAIAFFEAITGDVTKLKKNSPELTLRNYLESINSGMQHPMKQRRTDFTATLSACWSHMKGNKMDGITHKEVWP